MIILDAVGAPELLAGARAIAFEYMALTQVECGRSEPATADDLPPVLRRGCVDIADAYGAFLLAYRDCAPVASASPVACVPPAACVSPVACVGLTVAGGIATVSRLYVRPAHRGTGVARVLMHDVHRRALGDGARRIELDVMASRIGAIALYRSLGYIQVAGPTSGPVPMLTLALSPRHQDHRVHLASRDQGKYGVRVPR